MNAQREKDKITIEYLVNVNRNLEDNLIVNLKNEIYELKKELSLLQQEKEELINILENVNNEIFQYEVRGLLVNIITDGLRNKIKEILIKESDK